MKIRLVVTNSQPPIWDGINEYIKETPQVQRCEEMMGMSGGDARAARRNKRERRIIDFAREDMMLTEPFSKRAPP